MSSKGLSTAWARHRAIGNDERFQHNRNGANLDGGTDIAVIAHSSRVIEGRAMHDVGEDSWDSEKELSDFQSYPGHDSEEEGGKAGCSVLKPEKSTTPGGDADVSEG